MKLNGDCFSVVDNGFNGFIMDCVKVYMGWVASVNIRPNSRCNRVATILSGYSVSDRKDLAHFVLIYTIMVHF